MATNVAHEGIDLLVAISELYALIKHPGGAHDAVQSSWCWEVSPVAWDTSQSAKPPLASEYTGIDFIRSLQPIHLVFLTEMLSRL